VKGPLWVVVALLAACGSAPQRPSTPVDVAAQTKKEDTTFDSSAKFTGPTVRGEPTWLVRAWRDRQTGIVSRQLYVTHYYFGSGWRFYRTASFEGGEQAQATRIDSSPRCTRNLCSYTEIVGVSLPPAQWAKALQSGLTVRINAQSGDRSFVTIPAAYAQGFESAIK
jgi:hypothetical protein